jgi:hypothetical protein
MSGTDDQSSPLIDDELLKAAAPFLGNLRRLTLWGCTKLTKSSVYKVLEESTGMQELSLDILPHSVSSHPLKSVWLIDDLGNDGPIPRS